MMNCIFAIFSFQVCGDPRSSDIPAPPPSKYRDTGPIVPIPKEIRPTLVKYRYDGTADGMGFHLGAGNSGFFAFSTEFLPIEKAE